MSTKISTPEDLKLQKQLDWILVIIIFLIIGAATGFTMAITLGDWEYWVDWKDRRYWPLIPPVLLMVFPAGISAAVWQKFRLPIGCTFVVLAYTVLKWGSLYLNFHIFAGYPMSAVWQSVFLPMALVVDATLVITRSVFLTGLGGAFLWGILIYPSNWPLLAGFHEPIDYHGELMTAADLLGYEYVRTGLPEYVRLVERTTLRTFGDAVTPLTAVFAGFLCVIVFYVFWGVGTALTRQSWTKKV